MPCTPPPQGALNLQTFRSEDWRAGSWRSTRPGPTRTPQRRNRRLPADSFHGAPSRRSPGTRRGAGSELLELQNDRTRDSARKQRKCHCEICFVFSASGMRSHQTCARCDRLRVPSRRKESWSAQQTCSHDAFTPKFEGVKQAFSCCERRALL